MSKIFFSSRKTLPLFCAALLCLGAGTLSAQNRGTTTTTQNRGTFGGFSGFGGFGGTSSSSNSNSSRQYNNSTLVGDATITSDPDTRRLIVVTDEATNENIRSVIEQLDKPKPQVLINVIFLQVSLNDDLDLGVSGTYKNDDASQIVKTVFGAPTTGASYALAYKNVDATIHALSTYGKTEVLSRPSILARSSQQATILVGQQVPFVTNSRVDATNGAVINTIQYQDIGIILRVTPFITATGMVEMIVSPEISSLSDKTVPISNNVNASVIDMRSADTVVVTPSDKTVVIGGLISKQNTSQDNKVPILGDIPLLGAVFKRKTKSAQKTELLIFLTPHVVPNPEDLSRMSEVEQKRLEMAPKSFEKKELNKYIGNPEQEAKDNAKTSQ